jgi:hypothetical protein
MPKANGTQVLKGPKYSNLKQTKRKEFRGFMLQLQLKWGITIKITPNQSKLNFLVAA